MRRRDFVTAGVVTWVRTMLGWSIEGKSTPLAGGNPADQVKTISLEDSLYRIEFESDHGRIMRIFDKTSKLDLLVESRLADNFKLLLPLPDLESNYILGREQRLTSFDQGSDRLVLHWQGPLSNSRGAFDVDASLNVLLTGRSIEFRLVVRNGTQSRMAEAWYPILGGITGLGDRQDTLEAIPHQGGSTETNLFQQFPAMNGLGIPYVEAYWSYPRPLPMSWMSLQNQKLNRTMYFATHDKICRYKTLRFELHPGIGSRQLGGNWPRREDVGKDLPLGLKLHWTHYPYTKPNEVFEGPPVVIQFHNGDWHDSARIYRDWFKSQFSILEPSKSWLRQEMAFVDTMVLLPEGDVILKFAEVPGWAKSALNHGVKSVLISGWNVGGHDGSYPYYDPDPRLGTWDDLAAAIRECHRMGVKVFFFGNIQPVRVDTEWYRKELHRYVAMDKWGVPYGIGGWGMGTLSARLGFTRPPLISASSGIPEYRKIIVEKMTKLAQIGADGIHIDKVWPTMGLDFNPLSTLNPDQTTSEGRLSALDEILKSCQAVNPNFCLSVECAWDRALTSALVSWAWHNNAKDHVPMFKFTFPEWLPNMPVPQPYDYTAVNNAIRYGYQIFLGPGNYTQADGMDYAPMKGLSAYVKEIVQMPEGLKEIIYRGELLDTLPLRFEGPKETRHGAFRNPLTGKHACVLVNPGPSPSEISLLALDGNSTGSIFIYQPFEKQGRTSLPAKVRIPSERLAIVAEI